MNDGNYVYMVFYYDYSVFEMSEILKALPMHRLREKIYIVCCSFCLRQVVTGITIKDE